MKTSIPVYAALLFLTSLLVVSCYEDSGALNSTLSKVEKLIDAHPDSALNLLKAIPNPEKLHGKSQADYALLMTQAMDKNYIKFSSDSLIAVALNYYTVDQRDPAMKAKTQFYYGRVMLELDKHEEALKSFFVAKDFYDRLKNSKMTALIAEEIGIINRMQKMYKDALDNFRVSLIIHQQLKDSLSIARTSQNLARVYLCNNQLDSCFYYFNKALKIAEMKKDNSEASILHELGILYRSIEDFPKAEYYFLGALKKEPDKEKQYMECLSIGFLYLTMNRIEDARKYLQQSVNIASLYTKFDAYNCLYLLEKEEGHFREAMMYREKADSIHSITEEINSREQIADLQKKYENEKLQKENLQIKVHYTHSILIGTIAFMIALFLVGYFYYKNKNSKKRIAEIEQDIRKNEQDIERYQREIQDIYDSKEQLEKEHLIKIGELNGKIIILTNQNKVLNKRSSDLGGEASYKVISEHFIPAFRLLLALKEGTYKGKLSSNETEKLLGLFDLLYLNYVSRLRERSSSLTKHDLEICCLLKLGMTHEELSRIFNTAPESLTRAKTRLKGRLNIPSSDDLELFLRDF